MGGHVARSAGIPTARIPQARDIVADYEKHQRWPDVVTKKIARHFLHPLRPSPRRFLFLGTATGLNDALPVARISDPRDRILAVDIEDRFLQRLRDHGRAEGLANVNALKRDVTEDLSVLGKFDLVTLLFVIHRLKNWKRAVKRLMDRVAPGGSFYASEFAGPSGVIHLANEKGGNARNPIARLLRRYFDLASTAFDPELKSSSIRPVLDLIGGALQAAGHRDFAWRQTLTVGDVFEKIEARAYAPFWSSDRETLALNRLRAEFLREWKRRLVLVETIRIYRFVRREATSR